MTKHDVIELDHWLRARRAEYVRGVPTVSDYDYDAAFERLKKLVSHTPAMAKYARVLRTVGDSQRARRHLAPMLSLRTFFDTQEAEKFLKRFTGDLVKQPKLDGVSLSLRYERSLNDKTRLALEDALLRGDGVRGESVLHNTRGLGIPGHIFARGIQTIEIRGEVVIPKSAAKTMREHGYKSLRNAVAGMLRRKSAENNPLVVLKARFVAWGLGYIDTPAYSTETALLADLERIGFNVVPYIRVSPGSWKVSLTEWKVPYECDGIVVKLNNRHSQVRLGANSHHPLWSCAIKPDSLCAEGVLADVEWQLGRTGILTPVAKLETPVRIQGADISSVTLHNLNVIGALGISIGDRVLVERRGGVIPKIARRIPMPRRSTQRAIVAPKDCPSCGARTDLSAGTLRCSNIHCRGRSLQDIEHIARVFEIDGIGPGLANRLRTSGLVSNPWDIFDLSEAKLVKNGWGEVSACNLMRAIRGVKSVTFAQLLTALNVRGLGSEMSAQIARIYKTPKILLASSGYPSNTTDNLHHVLDQLRQPVNVRRLKALANSTHFRVAKTATSTLKASLVGKTFMFTGRLSESRGAMKNFVLRHGGENRITVSRKLSYLVCGDSPTAHKVEKARALGVKVIDEEILRSMAR